MSPARPADFRRNRGAAGEKGFTLLEVIVALAILAAGIVGLVAMFSGSLRLAEGTREISEVSVLASQRMEEALLVPDPAPGEESGDFGEKYRWTTRTAFLSPEEDSPFQPVRIEVIISWDDAGQERSVDLSATRWIRREDGAGG